MLPEVGGWRCVCVRIFHTGTYTTTLGTFYYMIVMSKSATITHSTPKYSRLSGCPFYVCRRNQFPNRCEFYVHVMVIFTYLTKQDGFSFPFFFSVPLKTSVLQI